MHACWQWTDTPERSGVISRCFHGGMGLLVLRALLVLIAGHIGIALMHGLVRRDGVFGRMAGR